MDLNNKTNRDRKIFDILLILLFIIISVYLLHPFSNPPSEKPMASIELYQFNDLYGNNTLNVELWLKNIGDTTAYNITIYIRCRNQNGILLYNNTIRPTSLFLRPNETCTAIYTLILDNTTHRIYHTIEVTWDTGRKTYSKLTDISITFENTDLETTIGG